MVAIQEGKVHKLDIQCSVNSVKLIFLPPYLFLIVSFPGVSPSSKLLSQGLRSTNQPSSNPLFLFSP